MTRTIESLGLLGRSASESGRLRQGAGGHLRGARRLQEDLPAVIPPEACYLGWQEPLTLLAKLVEAEVSD